MENGEKEDCVMIIFKIHNISYLKSTFEILLFFFDLKGSEKSANLKDYEKTISFTTKSILFFKMDACLERLDLNEKHVYIFEETLFFIIRMN